MSTFRRYLMMVANAVRSCFGRGVWIPAKPWIGTDKWKNSR